MMKIASLLFSLMVMFISCIAQNRMKIFHITSSHTSFPDTARANGHNYKNVFYDAATHYSDSSVLIIAPENLNANKKVDMVFWFHGWGNNIDSAAVRYKLIKQFADARLNAVLVLSETAKNSPDSYGGKLEQPGMFKELVTDVLNKLKKEKSVGKKCKTGNIILAGHSGAYRVMAYILQNGKLDVQEVILFDALYSETDKFLQWISKDKHQFIDIYTDGGGTDAESKTLIKRLTSSKIAVDTAEEKDLTPQAVQTKRIIFIHSLHKHNDIINDPDNFKLFLENSPFLEKLRAIGQQPLSLRSLLTLRDQ